MDLRTDRSPVEVESDIAEGSSVSAAVQPHVAALHEAVVHKVEELGGGTSIGVGSRAPAPDDRYADESLEIGDS